MRRAILSICLLIMLGGAAAAQTVTAEASVTPIDGGAANVFIDGGVGAMEVEGEDSTLIGTASINAGFPIYPPAELGLELGAQGLWRDGGFDFTAAAGAFRRGMQWDAMPAAWSVQLLYLNTSDHADLWGLRPVGGIQIDDMNYVDLAGVWGINDNRDQELVNQAMLLWGSDWGEGFRSEVGIGYQWSDVNEVHFGANFGYQINPSLSANVLGQFDTEGTYWAMVALVYDLGAGGRNDTFNTISGEGADAYKPFPLIGLPIPMYQSED